MKKIVLILTSIIFLIILCSCKAPGTIDYDKIVENKPVSVNKDEASTFTLSFETNGGKSIDPVQGKIINTGPDAYKDGYTFGGWYVDPSLTTKAIFPLTLTEDRTLYAKWELNSYSVRFESNGGARVNTIKDTKLLNPPTIEKTNYAFQGWYLDKALTKKAVFPIYLEKDITLYAKWLQTKETITCQNTKIKDNSAYNSRETINITPKNLDLNKLAEQGYLITITVTYDVNYTESYDLIWFGPPEYECYLYKGSVLLEEKENLNTSTSAVRRTITYTGSAATLKGSNLWFEVSTDNIQNIINFSNITVTYKCTK